MPRAPVTLLAASTVEVLEGVAVVGLGVSAVVLTIAGTAGDLRRAFGLMLFTLLGGAALIFVGIGLMRCRRWSRAPAVVTQLLAGLVGFSLIRAAQLGLGVPLLVVAVCGLVLLFVPSTNRALPTR